jgi:hypothetical protein
MPVGALRSVVLIGGSDMSTTKLYVLKKDGLFVSRDGKTMTDRPSQAIRLSKTLCRRRYPGYEMLMFPEAYDQWYAERNAKKEDIK